MWLMRILMCLCWLAMPFSGVVMAGPPDLSGVVTAGSTDNSLTIRVKNPTQTAAADVRVKVIESPAGLLNIKVEPTVINSIPTGGTAVFRISFDVAEKAEPVDSAEVVFSVESSNVRFESPYPKLAVAIVEPEAQGTGGVEGDDSRILKLVDIQWEAPLTAAKKSGKISRTKNEAGFSVAYEKRSKGTAENYGIGFTNFPLEIDTGKPFEVRFEGLIGQAKKYRCTTPGWRFDKPYARAQFIASGDHDIAVHEIFSAPNEVLVCPPNSLDLLVEDSHQSLVQVKVVFTPMEGRQRKDDSASVESTHYTYTTAIVGEGEAQDSGGERKILIYWRDDPESEKTGKKPVKKSGSLTLTLQGFDPADGVVRLIYRSVAEGGAAIQNVTAYLRPEVPPLMEDPEPNDYYVATISGNKYILDCSSTNTDYVFSEYEEKFFLAKGERVQDWIEAKKKSLLKFCRWGGVIIGEKDGDHCTGDGFFVDVNISVSEPISRNDYAGYKITKQELDYPVGYGKGPKVADVEAKFAEVRCQDNPRDPDALSVWLGEKNQKDATKTPSVETGKALADNQVDLPDVHGKTYAEAVAAVEAAGLVPLAPKLGSNAPNPSLAGRVELAVPAVDGQLRRGDKIGLRIFGKAVVGVPLPNVVGLGVREAAKVVKKAGLEAAFEMGPKTTDPLKDQTVASQFPAPGVEIEAGKAVKMIVMTLKKSALLVPDLRGMPISQANQVLKDQGLIMAPVVGEQAPPNKNAVGQVHRQSPEPGLEVAEGGTVRVWIYGEMKTPVAAPVATGGSVKTTWLPDFKTGTCPKPGDGVTLFEYKSFFIGGKARCVYGEGCDSNGRNCFSTSGLTAWYDREIKEYTERIEDDRFAKGEWVIFSGTKRAYVTFDTVGFQTPKTNKPETFWKNLAKELLRIVEPHAAPRNFGQNTDNATSRSVTKRHLCKDPAIQPESYVLKYARIYGGGETTFFIKQNHLCYRQGYAKIIGSKVENFECQDADFNNCSLKSTTNAERREYGDGAYSLYFDGGKSWWTIRPNK